MNDLPEPDQGELTPEEMSIPVIQAEPTRPKRTPPPTTPALTINIQSWATPIVGIFMLIAGLLGGYFLRPLFDTPIIMEATETPSASAEQPTSPAAQAPTEPVSEDQAARQQELMNMVIAQTRHFKGAENAPITLIEFSDFQ
ncbi:MAG TPA: hypothetical protein PK530_17635 [Anaerolineales bacterium]|nr:hypothetical protein [Anaerolineales bacterium]